MAVTAVFPRVGYEGDATGLATAKNFGRRMSERASTYSWKPVIKKTRNQIRA